MRAFCRARVFWIAALIGAAACSDETVAGFADPDATWHLTELDGATWPHPATLRFDRRGGVVGKGPCNSFSARQGVPYPWIDITELTATKRACPHLAAEVEFFTALTAMALVEVSGPVLILSNDAGREMVFEAR